MNTPAAYWYQIDKGHQVDKVERLDQWDFVFSPWHFGTKILLMAVLSITMHGCTRLQIPLLQRDVPATWHHISHSQHAVSVPQPDLKNWWRAFADQELEKIVINALRSNLDLQQSVGRIRAARALGQYISNKLKPSLTFRTDSTPYPGVDTSYFVAGFDATWELGIFGSHNSEILGAQSKLNLALAETQAARVSVVAEVVRTYIKLRNTQQKLVLLNNLARTKKILLTLVRIRQTLGFASMVDVSRSEGGYTESLVSISQIREIEEKSLQQLAVLLGYTEPDPIWRKLGSLPTISSFHIESEPADLLRTRPEIRYAEENALLAASRLGLAKADLYPKISLGGGISVATRINGLSMGAPTQIFSIGPQIDIPLFNWGARRAIVSARDTELSAALLAYRQAIVVGVAEVESALTSLQHKQYQVQREKQRVGVLMRFAKKTKSLWDLQLANRYDWATAHMAVDEARLDQFDAKYAESIAFISLYKALGGAPPLPHDVGL